MAEGSADTKTADDVQISFENDDTLQRGALQVCQRLLGWDHMDEVRRWPTLFWLHNTMHVGPGD